MHKSTVSRWENGETQRLQLAAIEKLAKYFGVNPAWLSGKDVPQKIESVDEADKKSPPTKTVDEQIEELLEGNEPLRKLADIIIDFPDEDLRMIIGLAKAYRESKGYPPID